MHPILGMHNALEETWGRHRMAGGPQAWCSLLDLADGVDMGHEHTSSQASGNWVCGVTDLTNCFNFALSGSSAFHIPICCDFQKL